MSTMIIGAIGLDAVAGLKYQDVILKALPNSWGVGFLDDEKTFKDTTHRQGLSFTRKLAKRKYPFAKIELMWRDNHDFDKILKSSKSPLPELLKKARNYNKIAKKFPDFQIYISPFLEHDIGDNIVKYLNEFKKAAPNCIIVNTPYTGKRIDSCPTMVHLHQGKKVSKPKAPYLFSEDGRDFLERALNGDKNAWKECKNFRGADLYLYWHPNNNGKKTTLDKTKREKRTNFLTVETLRKIVKMLDLIPEIEHRAIFNSFKLENK